MALPKAKLLEIINGGSLYSEAQIAAAKAQLKALDNPAAAPAAPAAPATGAFALEPKWLALMARVKATIEDPNYVAPPIYAPLTKERFEAITRPAEKEVIEVSAPEPQATSKAQLLLAIVSDANSSEAAVLSAKIELAALELESFKSTMKVKPNAS
jgi:hypothetical protein